MFHNIRFQIGCTVLASDIPNIYRREGFLDLVALGNLCLFASALNVDPEEGKHAVMVAVTAYKALCDGLVGIYPSSCGAKQRAHRKVMKKRKARWKVMNQTFSSA